MFGSEIERNVCSLELNTLTLGRVLLILDLCVMVCLERAEPFVFQNVTNMETLFSGVGVIN